MDNVERLETLVNERYQAGLQESRQAMIDSYVEELHGMTVELETIQGMEVSAIITNESADSLRKTIHAIRGCIGEMYTRNRDVFSIVLSSDEVVHFDPIMTRYIKAVHEFESRSIAIVIGLERLENLQGTVN